MHAPAVARPRMLLGVAKQWRPEGPFFSGLFFVSLPTLSALSLMIHVFAAPQLQLLPSVSDA